jgi:xanthine dehydrogenase/oxidase
MVACEHVIDHLAVACGVSNDELRRTNMYETSQVTPFGMIIGEQFSGKWNVPLMWDRLHHELGVSQRRLCIDEFNSRNKWLKRGLSLVPTKFGIAFTAKYMNQGVS